MLTNDQHYSQYCGNKKKIYNVFLSKLLWIIVSLKALKHITDILQNVSLCGGYFTHTKTKTGPTKFLLMQEIKMFQVYGPKQEMQASPPCDLGTGSAPNATPLPTHSHQVQSDPLNINLYFKQHSHTSAAGSSLACIHIYYYVFMHIY